LVHRFALGREDRLRRINFVSRMSENKAFIGRTEDLDFLGRAANIMVDVEKECGKVGSAISRSNREKFDATRKALASKTVDDLQDTDNSKLVHPRAFITYQSGRAIISSLLSDLIKCAE